MMWLYARSREGVHAHRAARGDAPESLRARSHEHHVLGIFFGIREELGFELASCSASSPRGANPRSAAIARGRSEA